MKTFTSTYTVENMTVRFVSEIVDGEKMDTHVFFDSTYICTIIGAEIGSFMRDLKSLVENHRI